MKVLEPTQLQYEKYKNVIPFVKDIKGRNIIGFGILEDPNFFKYKEIIESFNVIFLS
jgi:hypothetical protein